jgi:hypothetical protein
LAYAGPDRIPNGRDFKALAALGRDRATTGILVVIGDRWLSCGHFCVGRDLPLRYADQAGDLARALEDTRLNRAVVDGDASLELQRSGFAVVERRGSLDVLARSSADARGLRPPHGHTEPGWIPDRFPRKSAGQP